jgi:Short C-terminal domain
MSFGLLFGVRRRTVEKPPISVADELEKLATLKEKGILNADEFDAQKRKLLGL